MKGFFSLHVRPDFVLHAVLVLGGPLLATVILAQWAGGVA